MGRRKARHHLAVIRRPYLRLLVSGRKRIECRILRRRLAPVGTISPGDRIWFKQRCGPVLATAKVARVRWQTLHNCRQFDPIRRRYGKQICAEPGFWPTQEGVWHVGLIWLTEVDACGPIAIKKRDRRGWVVLPGAPKPARTVKPFRAPRANRQEAAQ